MRGKRSDGGEAVEKKNGWTDFVSLRLILVEHSSVKEIHRNEKTISSVRASGAELGRGKRPRRRRRRRRRKTRTCRDRNEDTRYSNEAVEKDITREKKSERSFETRDEAQRQQLEDQREGGMVEGDSPVLGRCRDPESLQVALCKKIGSKTSATETIHRESSEKGRKRRLGLKVLSSTSRAHASLPAPPSLPQKSHYLPHLPRHYGRALL